MYEREKEGSENVKQVNCY